jgi:hypothetical protein
MCNCLADHNPKLLADLCRPCVLMQALQQLAKDGNTLLLPATANSANALPWAR